MLLLLEKQKVVVSQNTETYKGNWKIRSGRQYDADQIYVRWGAVTGQQLTIEMNIKHCKNCDLATKH